MLAGIFYLLIAPATATSLAAGCTTVPPSASSPKLTKCKYLVLGGGPGGMFSAYLLRTLGRGSCARTSPPAPAWSVHVLTMRPTSTRGTWHSAMHLAPPAVVPEVHQHED